MLLAWATSESPPPESTAPPTIVLPITVLPETGLRIKTLPRQAKVQASDQVDGDSPIERKIAGSPDKGPWAVHARIPDSSGHAPPSYGLPRTNCWHKRPIKLPRTYASVEVGRILKRQAQPLKDLRRGQLWGQHSFFGSGNSRRYWLIPQIREHPYPGYQGKGLTSTCGLHLTRFAAH